MQTTVLVLPAAAGPLKVSTQRAAWWCVDGFIDINILSVLPLADSKAEFSSSLELQI